jgi:hypothetical protein
MEQSPFVFLLGGHDLEMIEIKKILSSKNLLCFDKNLQRNNAQLSQHKEVLNDQDYFVGIELESDLTPPSKYKLIDHHNQNAGNPSSIEQVANMLNIQLTREQQLVAANDRGYIPAMIEMGATPYEIAEIRRRDREAQGVTAEDEWLAEASIRDQMRVIKGITVIRSHTPRFSAIYDRLYPCSKLLIYTDNELAYYGDGVPALIHAYQHLITQKKAYYGGGSNGFFGIYKNKFTTEGLIQLRQEIILLIHLT